MLHRLFIEILTSKWSNAWINFWIVAILAWCGVKIFMYLNIFLSKHCDIVSQSHFMSNTCNCDVISAWRLFTSHLWSLNAIQRICNFLEMHRQFSFIWGDFWLFVYNILFVCWTKLLWQNISIFVMFHKHVSYSNFKKNSFSTKHEGNLTNIVQHNPWIVGNTFKIQNIWRRWTAWNYAWICENTFYYYGIKVCVFYSKSTEWKLKKIQKYKHPSSMFQHIPLKIYFFKNTCYFKLKILNPHVWKNTCYFPK